MKYKPMTFRERQKQYDDTPTQYINGLVIYEHPRNAIFLQPTGEYDIKKGPVQQETEVIVIGEDNHCYITQTFKTHRFMHQPNVFTYGKLMYGIGFHKTRLVRFVETQLELF
jgi:hypothetical protein